MTNLATNPQGGEAVLDGDVIEGEFTAQGVDADAHDENLDDNADDQTGLEGDPDQQTDAVDEEFEEVDRAGKKYRVPKALAPELLMHADYTRKTQEVASTRQELERSQQAFAQQVQAHQAVTKEIGQYHALAAQIAQLDPTAIAELAREDPGAAMQYQLQRQALMEQQAQLGQQITQKQQNMALEQTRATAKLQQDAFAQLQRDIPGFTGETVTQIEKFGAETYGFTLAEFSQVSDPRQVKVLHDAMQWRQHQSTQQRTAKVQQTQRTAPAQTVRGTSGRFTPAADTDDFAAFERLADDKLKKRA